VCAGGWIYQWLLGGGVRGFGALVEAAYCVGRVQVGQLDVAIVYCSVHQYFPIGTLSHTARLLPGFFLLSLCIFAIKTGNCRLNFVRKLTDSTAKIA